MSQTPQMPLSVQLPDDESFDSFQSETNTAAVTLLSQFVAQNQLSNSTIHGCYLFGMQGVGKSHLLHACCAYAQSLNLTSVCLSFAELEQLSTQMLDGLEAIDVICLDDIQMINKHAHWQQAVFDLYNRVIEQDKRLIISGNRSISDLSFTLPDLTSRLTWGHVIQIKPLTDEEKLVAVQYRAQQRGLFLSDEAGRFLISRIERDMKTLIDTLDKLDRASIREQRRITIPFIKETLF